MLECLSITGLSSLVFRLGQEPTKEWSILKNLKKSASPANIRLSRKDLPGTNNLTLLNYSL